MAISQIPDHLTGGLERFLLRDDLLLATAKVLPRDVGRTAPGESGQSDYRPFFRVLKNGDYDGLISVEAKDFDVASSGRKVLEFLRKQWNEA